MSTVHVLMWCSVMSLMIYLSIYLSDNIFSNFQYFWTKTFGDSYTSIRQIFSTWQWFPSIWCDYIWICKKVIYLNEKAVKVVKRSKFTIVNMFSMHINNFFFLFYLFFLLLKDCVFSGLFVFRTTWCRDFFISTLWGVVRTFKLLRLRLKWIFSCG